MSEEPLDVLLVEDPAIYELERRAMIGRPFRLYWDELATWLSRPSVTSHKAELGAWTPGRFKANRKIKANLEHASALTIDVDEDGDTHRIADLLAGHCAIVHSTYSSTPTAPRCRVVMPFASPVDASTYERTWRVVAAHLNACDVIVDAGTKDAGRLNYLPCIRVGAEYVFRRVVGELLDASAVLDAQPPEPPRSPSLLPRPEHRDKYIAGALRSASDAVAGASEGGRHFELSKQAYSLARLGLLELEIATVLVPAFVASAGERRRREGERTVRDAVRARGAA